MKAVVNGASTVHTQGSQKRVANLIVFQKSQQI